MSCRTHARSSIPDVAGHLKLEPEEKRATLLSWASDRAAVKGQPAPRPPGASNPLPVDDVMEA
jgi:hypothetical protein